jgi:hypothetical protein
VIYAPVTPVINMLVLVAMFVRFDGKSVDMGLICIDLTYNLIHQCCHDGILLSYPDLSFKTEPYLKVRYVGWCVQDLDCTMERARKLDFRKQTRYASTPRSSKEEF